MSEKYQLSLRMAILININAMLGSGIFINTAILINTAGALGTLSYALVGILMLPLILSISKLLELHPSGGFYMFGKEEITPFIGFFSTWSYFIAKLASSILTIHISVLLLQQIIPALSFISPFMLDICILSSFIALNMRNLRTGGMIQAVFMGLKSIPIIFVILLGLYYITGSHLTVYDLNWSAVPVTIPIVLYAIMGFETACSISSKIKDAAKNAPRAVLISYAIVILTAVTFQALLFTSIGNILAQSTDFRITFPTLLAKVFPGSIDLQQLLTVIAHLSIVASALGGSYGVLFSNNWNLYTLASHGHTFFAHKLIELNKQMIPWLCVFLEGVVCLIYLAVSRGNQIPLQQIAGLGVVFAYTISVIALITAKYNRPTLTISWWIPILGLFNCLILITACINGLIKNGATSLLAFTCLLIFGIWMYWQTKKEHLIYYKN